MLTVKGIKQVDERSDPELINDNVVTALTNMILKGGKAYKRGAFKRFNSNSGGTNTFISLHNVQAKNTYVSATDFFIQLLFGLVGDGDDDDDGILKWSKAGTGTWNNVRTGLNDVNHLRMAVYNDKFYFTNGYDIPFVVGDYEDNAGTIEDWDLQIDAPEVQDIIVTRTSGGDLDASSRYRYVLVYTTDDGQQSPPSKPISYVDSGFATSTDTTNRTLRLSNLPISSDTRVTGRKIYRTEGNGKVYYLLASIDNVQEYTSPAYFTDDNADSELKAYDTVEYHHDLETAKYALAHQERLWLGNVVTGIGDTVLPPDHAPFDATPADNSNPGLGNGTYRWAVSWVDNQGRESQLSSYVEATVDHTLIPCTENEAKVTLEKLPQPRLGAGEYSQDIAFRIIYRTKAGETTPYYAVEEIDNDTVVYALSYDDSTNDSALGSDTYPKYPEGRSTIDKTHKCGLIYSNPGDPSELPVLNQLEIFPEDGDEITGLVGLPDGVLVLKTNSICKVFTQGNPSNWRVVKQAENLGCDEPNSVAEVSNRIYFMNKYKVYRYPDNMLEPISEPKENTLNGLTVRDSIFYVEKRWYVLATDSYAIHVYDEKENCWYAFVQSAGLTAQSLEEVLFGTNKGKLLLGVYSEAKVLYYDEDTNLDYSVSGGTEDTQIVCTIKSKHWYKGELIKFRLLKLWSNYKKLDGQTVNHKIVGVDTGAQVAVDDTDNATNSTDYKNYYKVTDAMTGTLKRANKLRYEISGAGLDEFNFAEIEAMEESGRRPNS